MVKVKVWDGFVRFYHWTQLILLLALWWSAEFGFMDLHLGFGLILLNLWVTRIIWGFIGSQTACFRDFITTPWQVVRDIRLELGGRHTSSLGHSPAGGYMILALMLLIGVQLTTGLFATDDILTEGPLYSYLSADTTAWLTRIHHLNFKLLVAFSAVHIIVIGLFTLQRRQLIQAMVMGFKHLEIAPPIRLRSGWLGFALFVVCLGVILAMNPDITQSLLGL